MLSKYDVKHEKRSWEQRIATKLNPLTLFCILTFGVCHSFGICLPREMRQPISLGDFVICHFPCISFFAHLTIRLFNHLANYSTPIQPFDQSTI
jgi:hypothetical protein